MNKQLANQGTLMYKIMTNIESKSVSFARCASSYIVTYEITCDTLDIPTTAPPKTPPGTAYFDTTSKRLCIHDRNDWNHVTLNV